MCSKQVIYTRAKVRQKTLVVTLSFLLVVLGSSGLYGSDSRHHDAHVHGIADMNVALDGTNLMIELKSPAANITGFEHAPETDEQRHKVHESIELLENGEKLFLLPAKADCSLHEASVSTDMEKGHDEEGHSHKHDSHGHDHDHVHSEKADHEYHGSHSEFEAMYHFECTNSDAIKSVDVQLFKVFHGFEKIHVQLLTPQKQTAATLNSKNSKISF